MRLATTIADFLRYCQDPIEALKCYEGTGFRYFDYSFYNDANADSLLMQDDFEKIFTDIKAKTDRLGYQFIQAHSPGGNPLSFDKEYPVLLESTIRSIKACRILQIPYIVVHSGIIGEVTEDEYFEKNYQFYKRLFPYMEGTGVSVLIENSTPANVRGNSFFFTGDEMKRFLEFANHPLLGACWDIGHGNIEQRESQYKSITDLGKHLKGLHIHDNLGLADEHYAPFYGTLNFDEIMCALKDVNYTSYFTFECTNIMLTEWAFPRRAYLDSDKLNKPPLELKRQAIKLLYDTGKHMLSSYNQFEK